MKIGQQKDPWLSSLINYTNETKQKKGQTTRIRRVLCFQIMHSMLDPGTENPIVMKNTHFTIFCAIYFLSFVHFTSCNWEAFTSLAFTHPLHCLFLCKKCSKITTF